ncbi:MAG: class I SAM-dependent rRNA methyltransferase [Treponema sp.]|jgi:23S rRNA (cytosine1962-C5)-methyltransferase|nr:class I SAM-dependent rRNA methyltransferase [Treponema sp.]
MKRIILAGGEEERILRGHPWVYDNEVEHILDGKAGTRDVQLECGECADVESSRKQYLGRAIVNPHSKIIARIYSPSKEGMDSGFFKRRIREAAERRTGAFDFSRESARVVFAEADFLPGLVIDRFTGWPLADIMAAVPERPLAFEHARAVLGPPQSWLSIQFLAWGMDSRRETILEAAESVLAVIAGAPAGIIEKSGARVRELEGLPLRDGLIRGTFPAGGIVIFDNGLPFAVNLVEGQKTGHYLDQRDNRLLAGKYAAVLCRETPGLRVLDACSYSGGFGIHILRAAEQARVTALDVSAAALETLKQNAALNGVQDRAVTVEADVFDFLRNAERAKEQFDMIILDPPAFAKSRTALGEALRGYNEINLRAITRIRHGGILVTCSCSHALDEYRFKRMVTDAAAGAERRLTQLDYRCQSPDHPVLLGHDESLYLKCGFYRVL